MAPKKKVQPLPATAPGPAGMPLMKPGKALAAEMQQIMGLNRLRTMRGKQGVTQPT